MVREQSRSFLCPYAWGMTLIGGLRFATSAFMLAAIIAGGISLLSGDAGMARVSAGILTAGLFAGGVLVAQLIALRHAGTAPDEMDHI